MLNVLNENKIDELIFTECFICSSKPGSPALCTSCISNRLQISIGNQIIKKLNSKNKRKNIIKKDQVWYSNALEKLISLRFHLSEVLDLIDRHNNFNRELNSNLFIKGSQINNA